MIQFKSSGIQHSPNSITNRSSVKNQHKQYSTNALNITSGGSQITANTNSNNMTRQTGINIYTHNGPICFRLTNV